MGLPGEPGRGVSEDLPLLPERLDLSAPPAHFLPLLGRQPVLAAAVIPIGLAAPVPNRLRGRLELPAELFRGPARPGQLDEPRPQLRRIRRSGLWHRGLPPPPKGNSVHGTGSSPLPTKRPGDTGRRSQR